MDVYTQDVHVPTAKRALRLEMSKRAACKGASNSNGHLWLKVSTQGRVGSIARLARHSELLNVARTQSAGKFAALPLLPLVVCEHLAQL